MIRIELSTSAHSEMVDITARVSRALEEAGVRADGVVHLFCPHTTAGLLINERADPDVAADILAYLERAVPWEGGWRHAEGNAAAHVRAALVGAAVWVPLEGGRLRRGRWQGIFFCEFDGPRRRTVWLQVLPSHPSPAGASR
ncbi:MAG: YjbQ family protein [Firmicutes bacterium]|nr:YjbQ family protein [Bacillota bacterium]